MILKKENILKRIELLIEFYVVKKYGKVFISFGNMEGTGTGIG